MSKFAKKATAEVAEDEEEKIPGFAKAAKEKKTKPAGKMPDKPTKGGKAAKEASEPKSSGPDKRKIKLLTKENPKREGSASYERFEHYRKAKTVQDFLDAGGTRADLKHDEAAGHIEIS